jgi:hypothetical protein
VGKQRLSPRPELRQLAARATRQGWTVRRTRGNHLRWESSFGAVIHSSITPSDGRAWRKVRAHLRRAGVRVP